MLQAFFHAWERRLAAVTKIASSVRSNGDSTGFPRTVIERDARRPRTRSRDWVSHVMADTDAFFTPPPTTDYTLTPAADGDLLTFPSALDHAARIEQHGALPVLSGAATGTRFDRLDRERAAPRCSCCRNGTPTPAATSACAGCSRGTA